MSGSHASSLSRLDSIVGGGIEAAVRGKHRWRLRRLGRGDALAPSDDGLWAGGDPPPRDRCALDVLVDGADAFSSIVAAIENARDFVHVTGWHIAPWFELTRGDRPAAVGELLADAAERLDVKVLVWAGAPVPAFHPTRKEVRDAVETLTRRTRIRCEADPREHPFHCHHEKTVVVDGVVAFVSAST
jgi:phosphatidylserine/phosphatidylglycerophosphate/cardiolipin synthase-like enzyme